MAALNIPEEPQEESKVNVSGPNFIESTRPSSTLGNLKPCGGDTGIVEPENIFSSQISESRNPNSSEGTATDILESDSSPDNEKKLQSEKPKFTYSEPASLYSEYTKRASKKKIKNDSDSIVWEILKVGYVEYSDFSFENFTESLPVPLDKELPKSENKKKIKDDSVSIVWENLGVGLVQESVFSFEDFNEE